MSPTTTLGRGAKTSRPSAPALAPVALRVAPIQSVASAPASGLRRSGSFGSSGSRSGSIRSIPCRSNRAQCSFGAHRGADATPSSEGGWGVLAGDDEGGPVIERKQDGRTIAQPHHRGFVEQSPSQLEPHCLLELSSPTPSVGWMSPQLHDHSSDPKGLYLNDDSGPGPGSFAVPEHD
jgi:hypothetical protein